MKNNAVAKITLKEKEHVLISRDGYEYNLYANTWRLSRTHTIKLNWIESIFDKNLQICFRKVLSHYAQKNGVRYTESICYQSKFFFIFVKKNRKSRVTSINASDFINYYSSLNSNEKYQAQRVRALLNTWVRLGYEGVNEDVLKLSEELQIPKDERGTAVRISCPKEGPLTDTEYEAFFTSLIKAFEKEKISLEEFIIVNLFLATGRRTIQIAHLKIKDFIGATAKDGQTFYLLRVPRVKQQSIWRTSFTDYALSEDLTLAINTYINELKTTYLHEFGFDAEHINDLPLLPSWGNLHRMTKKFGAKQLQNQLSIREFHYSSTNLAVKFKKTVTKLNVYSERTDEPLNLFPYRLRRTLASRAAREGYGVQVIARLLDHSNINSALVYTENTPEYLHAIDKAMAFQLADFAKAFAGVLVEREKDSENGKNPTNRIKNINTGEGVGTCGTYSFCTALSPIACYTCNHFQPWLDGPHETILEELIAKRKEIVSKTQDKTIASVNDRTIFAVAEVVKLCTKRKIESKLLTNK